MKIAIAQLNYTVGNFEHNKFKIAYIKSLSRMQVDFLSAMAVFTMSVVSTLRYIKNKVEFGKNIILFMKNAHHKCGVHSF